MVIIFRYNQMVINKKGGYAMNINELRAEIVRIRGTQDKFAESINWHRNKVSKMMNGKYVPNVDEAGAIANELNLSERKIIEIFLNNKSPNGYEKI